MQVCNKCQKEFIRVKSHQVRNPNCDKKKAIEQEPGFFPQTITNEYTQEKSRQFRNRQKLEQIKEYKKQLLIEILDQNNDFSDVTKKEIQQLINKF